MKTLAILLSLMFLLSGCVATTGIYQPGKGQVEGIPGKDCFTIRDADANGINLATAVIVDQKTGKVEYAQTVGQQGINKTVVEEILPTAGSVGTGLFTGVFFGKQGSSNTTNNLMQGQGQSNTQGQKIDVK